MFKLNLRFRNIFNIDNAFIIQNIYNVSKFDTTHTIFYIPRIYTMLILNPCFKDTTTYTMF